MNNKSIISLIKELKTFLKEKRKLSYEDPSINPVSSLAHLLSRKFVNNEIDLIKINSIIESLSNELIVQRAFNLNRSYGLKIKKVITSRTLWKDCIPSSVLGLTDFRFMNSTNKLYTPKQWDDFLEQCNWYKDKEMIKENQETDTRQYTQLKWKNTISTTSVQIGDLCKTYKFLI